MSIEFFEQKQSNGVCMRCEQESGYKLCIKCFHDEQCYTKDCQTKVCSYDDSYDDYMRYIYCDNCYAKHICAKCDKKGVERGRKHCKNCIASNQGAEGKCLAKKCNEKTKRDKHYQHLPYCEKCHTLFKKNKKV
jgi:hypothetical protein